jgi:two-component system, OmpR family, sensor kinase
MPRTAKLRTATPRVARHWNTVAPTGRRHLLSVWTGWAMGCVMFMVLMPGEETIPYHLGWAGFALAFGLGTWSRRQLVTALAWYTTATGVALEHSWWVGHISWDETTEIPLMFVLALLMVWNVLRRQDALTEVSRLAARDVQASHDRERLTQLTSHELRTPLTIARGYLELMQSRAVEQEDQQDLLVVTDELDRLSRVSDRLIRMIRLQDDTTSEVVDIDRVLAQCVERWRVVADRSWVLEAGAGSALGSSERLRTCLDTLVENAIRYTCVGDTIRLTGSRHLRHVVVGVLDSGVGLSDQQILTINSQDRPAGLPPDQPALPGSATAHDPGGLKWGPVDGLAGTGLGLSIVREIAHALGGVLHASRSPQGGAALVFTLSL